MCVHAQHPQNIFSPSAYGEEEGEGGEEMSGVLREIFTVQDQGEEWGRRQ